MDEKYLFLFNSITNAIADLDRIKCSLMMAQQQTEEMFMSGDSGTVSAENTCSE